MAEPAVSVLILAGGRSRRMGQDKVWMALDGVPLVERVVRRVLPRPDRRTTSFEKKGRWRVSGIEPVRSLL